MGLFPTATFVVLGFLFFSFFSMRNIAIATGEYYHIYNRGVDKRNTFLDASDYHRFLSFVYRSKFHVDTGIQMVHLHIYACMTNHFHFLVEQLVDNGIAQFMHRLSTSYTRFFNRKYQRSGTLFEARYKAKFIHNDAYLTGVAAYIHRNPLALPAVKTLDDFERYSWSSYSHYCGITQDALVDDHIFWDLFCAPHGTAQFHDDSSLVEDFHDDGEKLSS